MIVPYIEHRAQSDSDRGGGLRDTEKTEHFIDNFSAASRDGRCTVQRSHRQSSGP